MAAGVGSGNICAQLSCQLGAKQATRDLVIVHGPLLKTEESREDRDPHVEILQGQEVSLAH